MNTQLIIEKIKQCNVANIQISEIEKVFNKFGDMYILTKFIDTYYSLKMWLPIVSQFKNLTEAEKQDCFQDAQIRLFTKLENADYLGVGSLSSYFRTILWNKLIDASKKNRQTTELEIVYEDYNFELKDWEDWYNNLKMNMNNCLQVYLTQNTKKAILLMAQYDYSIDDIYRIIEIAKINLENDILNILTKLKDYAPPRRVKLLAVIFGYANENATYVHINSAKKWIISCTHK